MLCPLQDLTAIERFIVCCCSRGFFWSRRLTFMKLDCSSLAGVASTSSADASVDPRIIEEDATEGELARVARGVKKGFWADN